MDACLDWLITDECMDKLSLMFLNWRPYNILSLFNDPLPTSFTFLFRSYYSFMRLNIINETLLRQPKELNKIKNNFYSKYVSCHRIVYIIIFNLQAWQIKVKKSSNFRKKLRKSLKVYSWEMSPSLQKYWFKEVRVIKKSEKQCQTIFKISSVMLWCEQLDESRASALSNCLICCTQ